MKQLVYLVGYTRYQGSFYLRRIEPILKRYKVSKYYDQDCMKIFQKVSSVKKLPISNVESFLKSNFDLNKICKIVLTQNH